MTKTRRVAREGGTTIKRLEQYKDRWNAFGATAGILAISDRLRPADLRRFEIFQDYDDEFLETLSPDLALAKWQKGAVLFEAGAYLDLAFFIVKGAVAVHAQKPDDRAHPAARGHTMVVDAEVRRSPGTTRPARQSQIVFLASVDFDLPAGGGLQLGAGDFLGEIGAMNGWPQSVTARTASECLLLQIRVPALRRMKRKSPAFKQRLDKIYRARALFSQLKTAPLFQRCDPSLVEELARQVELVSFEPGEVIAAEGAPAESLYLVRSGFVRLAQKYGAGEMVLSYLSKGMTLGEIELLVEGMKGWHCTATSVEYTEVVKIAVEEVRALLRRHAHLERELWEAAIARLKAMGSNRRNLEQSEFLHTALQHGLVQGTSMLVIDLARCTRCDDCVRGCAATHGGRPRFVREGEKYRDFLLTRSCYHCHDPVCLVGCPTGAIRRAGAGEVVEIVDNLCIGCKACANNCPYDAIIMHDTGEVWAQNMIPEILRGKDRLLASKCDLCYQTGHEPACVANCPHGCAVRVNSVAVFQQLVARRA